jgi:hypothetical protein
VDTKDLEGVLKLVNEPRAWMREHVRCETCRFRGEYKWTCSNGDHGVEVVCIDDSRLYSPVSDDEGCNHWEPKEET